jgi:hypothetical protein
MVLSMMMTLNTLYGATRHAATRARGGWEGLGSGARLGAPEVTRGCAKQAIRGHDCHEQQEQREGHNFPAHGGRTTACNVA